MRILWMALLSVMLPLSGLAQLASNTMIKMRLQNIISGLDSKQFMTVYRMGGQYGRVEQETNQADVEGNSIIVNEPDLWVVKSVKKTAQHMLDTAADHRFKMPILSRELLPDLEFGAEFDFFKNTEGVRKAKITKQEKVYDRYTLVKDALTIVMIADESRQRPQRISVLYQGATVADYLYLEYSAGLKADLTLFNPPMGMDIIEMAPAGLENKESPFPLARAIHLPVPDKSSLERWKDEWGAFQHEPYDVSGMCHLTLPFQYEALDGGDTNEANAFAFLLSNALDWYPGSYCARHAYFVFKRSGKDIVDAGKTLNQSLIRDLARHWNATHEIAGTLIHSKDGYAARIKIFDHDGRSIHEENFERPRDYYELLGDVSIGIMRFLDYKPLPSLVAHLKTKRCAHHQSIIDLGKAAFAEERSDYEFGLYKTILERDPEFAEVRYWLSNQRYWKDNNREAYDADMALSFKSYYVEAVLADLMPDDAETVANVKKLVGEESPLIVRMELKNKMNGSHLDPGLIGRGIRSAEKYPNDRSLLMNLVSVFKRDGAGLADCDMLISLARASMENRFMPGSSEQSRYAAQQMAKAMMEVGRPDEAALTYQWSLASASEDEDEVSIRNNALHLGDALRQMGLLSEAYKAHLQALRIVKDPSSCGEHAARACVLAALMGEREKVAALEADHLKQITLSGWQPLINSYLNIVNRKPLDPAVVAMVKLKRNRRLQREALILLAQSDLASKKTAYRQMFDQYRASFPDDRELWILCDAYNLIAEGNDSASFYDSLRLLHGDDPWVQDAVSRYQKRGGKSEANNSDEIVARLKDCDPIRWPTLMRNGQEPRIADRNISPGAVTVAVDALLKTGQKTKAQELVLRYQNYVSKLSPDWVLNDQQFALRARCNHIYHLIERAQKGHGLSTN